MAAIFYEQDRDLQTLRIRLWRLSATAVRDMRMH